MENKELLWLLGAAVFWAVAGVALLILTAGCSLPPPYVYKQGEFDRASASFNKPLDVHPGVVVCYNENSTTPSEVRKLAQQACATEGGKAAFVTHVYDKCPALLISGAHFSCGFSQQADGEENLDDPTAVVPSLTESAARRDPQGYPATPSAIYDMHYQSPAQ
ncbi:hypothetical protein JCM17960_27090 [Magnetospira thiophila]